MMSFRAAAAGALAASLSLFQVTPATGQTGWPVFDSSEVLPAASGLSFTIRYPPWFGREQITSFPDDLPGSELIAPETWANLPRHSIQNFDGRDSRPGRVVTMTIIRMPLSETDIRHLEIMGPEKFWEVTARAIAAAVGAMEGSRALVFKGLQAFDLFISRYASYEPGNPMVGLMAQHQIVKDESLLILTCVYHVPVSQARAERLTSLRNPALAEYCTPFMESIEFRR
ncbi:MAG: hypothetical protein LBT40_09255 [Deltaproteobacteria bacterium]|jgi:hypothetical protein|nr:hypothetical protein [Deltaproteobacteria bacterium]